MKRIVVGTAGHIDHGKSSLVQALTGVDPDRLQEEQRRGITIELGFADLDLGDSRSVSFVDVPGHERFVRQMVAGASGFDAVLLVVAADQGVQPQTREHLEICRLLGIRRGAIALSKTDLVDEDLAAVVELELEEMVSGTFLEGAPIVSVSAKTGVGLDSLRDVLTGIVESSSSRATDGLARLPVDRSFVLKGFGTVVTGTLVSGTLQEGMELVVWPSGKRVRVRGLQIHGDAVDAVSAGSRVAVNLQSGTTAEVPRGATLAPPDAFAPTQHVRCRLSILEHARESLLRGGEVRFHQGTTEVGARLRVLDVVPDRIRADSNRTRQESDRTADEPFYAAELYFDEPVALSLGDRFILRRPAPLDTVAGGAILDTDPPRRFRGEVSIVFGARAIELATALEMRIASSAIAGCSMESLRGWSGRTRAQVDEALVEALATAKTIRAGNLAIDGEQWRAVELQLMIALEKYHAEHPLDSGWQREAARTSVAETMARDAWRQMLDQGETAGRLRLMSDRVALTTHEVRLEPDQQKLAARLEATYLDAGVAPPDLDAVLAADGGPNARPVLEWLLTEERLVRVDGGLLMHRSTLENLRVELAQRGETTPRFGVAQFKEWTGISRKHAIPLLEFLDAEGTTRRVGNEREILKRRLPTAE